MNLTWTIGRRIGAGFLLVTALAVSVALFALRGLDEVARETDVAIDITARNLIDAQSMRLAIASEAADLRGFLLTGDPRYLDALRADQTATAESLRALGASADDDNRADIARIADLQQQRVQAVDALLRLREAGSDAAAMNAYWNENVRPDTDELTALVQTYRERKEARLAAQTAHLHATTESTRRELLIAASLAILLAITVSWLLGRGISGQVGSAVAQITSSSVQLQAAANEQATSSREQTTAMTEVSTTLKELVATSKQMAESTQRVARIAEDTGRAADGGDATVQKAQQAFASIKRQVDLIVAHMVDLGRKSQQVGAILELINELAEQTNILSINATIESAGAGEAGRRFAVVAEEIRRLADRVAGSGREIRTLVDEIRSAANTTVMVTEDGSKAVDVGARHFNDVAEALSRIGAMVETSIESARQIDLGTRQQLTAVEQVNMTLVDLAQAARETDAGTRQTLETANYLSGLSKSLLQLIGDTRH